MNREIADLILASKKTVTFTLKDAVVYVVENSKKEEITKVIHDLLKDMKRTDFSKLVKDLSYSCSEAESLALRYIIADPNFVNLVSPEDINYIAKYSSYSMKPNAFAFLKDLNTKGYFRQLTDETLRYVMDHVAYRGEPEHFNFVKQILRKFGTKRLDQKSFESLFKKCIGNRKCVEALDLLDFMTSGAGETYFEKVKDLKELFSPLFSRGIDELIGRIRDILEKTPGMEEEFLNRLGPILDTKVGKEFSKKLKELMLKLEGIRPNDIFHYDCGVVGSGNEMSAFYFSTKANINRGNCFMVLAGCHLFSSEDPIEQVRENIREHMPDEWLELNPSDSQLEFWIDNVNGGLDDLFELTLVTR